MKLLICSNCEEFSNEIKIIKKNNIFYTRIERYEDNEMSIYIDEYEKLINEDILIIQSVSGIVNDALMEVLFSIDILNRIGVKSIKILFTYIGYSRQDRVESINSPLSFKVVAKMFSNLNISKIYFIDLHSSQTAGFFDVPTINIKIQDFIVSMFENKYKNPLLVSPDVGNAKNIINLSQKINIEYSIAMKYRPKANQSKILSFIGTNVENKDCIVLDDIIDSGGTICNVAEQLTKKGANNIVAYITHPVLSQKSFNRIENSYFTKLYISNTINSKKKLKEINSKKIEIFSITDWILKKILNDYK